MFLFGLMKGPNKEMIGEMSLVTPVQNSLSDGLTRIRLFFGLRFCSGRRVDQRSEIGDILSKGPFWDVVNLSNRLSSNSSDSNGKMVLTMNTF